MQMHNLIYILSFEMITLLIPAEPINGAKRRSGRNPGARVTNSALAEFKVVADGSKGVGMS